MVIRFKLTRTQKKALEPFFKKAVEEAQKNQQGIILGQLVPTKIGKPMSDECRFGFIPHEVGIKIMEILKEYQKQRKKQRAKKAKE